MRAAAAEDNERREATCPSCGHISVGCDLGDLLVASANHDRCCAVPHDNQGEELEVAFPGLATLLQEDDEESAVPRLVPDHCPDSDDEDSSDEDIEPAMCTEAFKAYLATLVEAREVMQVSARAMDTIKDGCASYVRALAEAISKDIEASGGGEAIRRKLKPLENIHSKIPTSKHEAKEFEKLFDVVHACKPRLVGYDIEGRPEYVHDMHFRNQLDDLLSSPELLNDALRDVPSEPGVSSDVRHGAVWRAHRMVRAETSPFLIQLFTDAMEVTNPLGAARTKWKFVFGYWSLLNLSAQHQTARSNMRLAFICTAEVFKKYGPATIISGGQNADGSWQDDTSFGAWMERGEEGTRAVCKPYELHELILYAICHRWHFGQRRPRRAPALGFVACHRYC